MRPLPSVCCPSRRACRPRLLRSRRSHALHHLRARKACSPTPRRPPSRNGTSRWSSNSTATPFCASPTSDRIGYHGLLSVDPNDIPAADLRQRRRLHGRRHARHHQEHGAARARSTSPSARGPNPYLGAGFFWYTEGNSSYNALQVDVTHRLTHGLQFRANYTWSKNLDMNSALTGAQANNQAQMILDRNDLRARLGTIGAEHRQPGQHLRHATSCPSARPARPALGAKAARRLAVERHRHAAERLSLHAADRLEPLRRWRHAQSRPAFAQSRVSPDPWSSAIPNQWFNPNAFVLPAAGTYGNLGRGAFTGPGLADLDLSLFKNHRHQRAHQPAIPRASFSTC